MFNRIRLRYYKYKYGSHNIYKLIPHKSGYGWIIAVGAHIRGDVQRDLDNNLCFVFTNYIIYRRS